MFNDALSFALKLEGQNRDPSGTMIDGLYDRAGASSATPLESVTYRMQRAVHLHQKTDSVGELALYQQILSDPHLRSVIVASGDNAARPAGMLVRAAVADLIQRCGVAIRDNCWSSWTPPQDGQVGSSPERTRVWNDAPQLLH